LTEKEFEDAMKFISEMGFQKNMVGLAASVAESLVRLVAAQEKLVELATIDLEEQVEAVAENKATELAKKMDEDKTRRSFIGKK
jgi:hypothetical protein